MNETYTRLREFFAEGESYVPFRLFSLTENPEAVPENCGLDYYSVYLFESGEYEFDVDFESYKQKGAGVSVLFPRQHLTFTKLNEARGVLIVFSEEMFCSEMLRNELKAYCINLKSRLNSLSVSSKQSELLLRLAEMMKELEPEDNALQLEQVRHFIKVIILKLMDYSKIKELNAVDTTESALFLQFTELIDEQYKELRVVSDYADRLGVSTRKLNELTKKYNHITALQLIHERIFLEAKRLLTFSGLTLKEIGFDLQFDSPSAFNKFIKSKSGVTPSQLQKELVNVYKRL